MSSHQTVKIFKKSSIPGVVVTQFVNDVPSGCSTPDFEKKPLTLTLQEGKNAIFRAVVKGVPAPEVKWSRTRKGMDDPAKYEMSFNSATNEFILQIKSLVQDDSDLYRCCAVNAYGEASCSAGLRIIQVGFKRKAKYVPVHAADELKKTLLDSRKMLRKRAAAPKPKPLDKEAVWQLLLHADRRDYEKICMKYGIADFRGMLRKLQEMRKETESEQDKLIHTLKNFEHIKVNKEGNATFSLEMELKNSNSNVYLLKDGERLRYGTGDEYRKHCLRRVGRRYYFTVNDVQPEDAGVYQVRVEDVPVFSTELDAQAIPARFRQPLSDVRCAEAGDAEFQCVLCTPCHQPLWLHKSHPLQASDKHQISVTPDGLTHKLIVRNVGPSDSGLYTLDAGQGSSSAWLLVEYAKGKRTQDEGEKIERETSEWLKETMADNERARKLRRQEQAAAEGRPSFSTSSGVEKSGWSRTGQGSSQGRGQGHSVDSDDGSQRFLGKEGLRKTHMNGEMGSGQFSGAGLDGDSAASDGSIFGLKGLGGRSGLRAVHGMDSVSGRAGPGGAVGGAGEWNSVDGRGEGLLGAVNVDMDDGEGLGSQHDKDGNLGDASYRAGFGGAGRLGGESSVPDGLDPDSTGVGASVGDLFRRTGPGAGGGGNAAGAGMAGGMRSHHGKDGHATVGDMNGAGVNREGQTGTPYGKDGLTPHASGQLGQTGRSGSLYGPGRLPGGDGATPGTGGNSAGEMEALYGPDGQALAAGAGGAGAGGFGSPYGKDGLPAGAGFGGVGAEGLGAPYGKDGLPIGAGARGAGGAGGLGSLYGKDGLPARAGDAGVGGFGEALYGPDGRPLGAGVGAGGGAGTGGFGIPYGKDGLPVGAGVGGVGVAGVGGFGSPYGKDGLPAGTGAGGAGGFGEALYDGRPLGAGVGARAGAGAGGFGFPYGKDGLPAAAGGAGVGGLGEALYGPDGRPFGAGVGAGAGAGAGGFGFPYGKDGLPAAAGGAGVGGLGEALYGPDGRPFGAGVGAGAGAGGFGIPYGKDGLPAGAGVGGSGGTGGLGSPYGKDGLPAGASFGGVNAGGFGVPYGKDGLPAGAGGAGAGEALYGPDGRPLGAGVAGAGFASARGTGAPYGKDGLPAGAGAGISGAGGVGSPYGKDGLPVGAGAGISAAGSVGSPYGKDGLPVGAGAGISAAGSIGSPYGKDGLPAGAGAGISGAGGVGSPYGKDGLPVGAGAGISGVGSVGSPYGKDGLPAGAGAGISGAGGVGSPYGKDGLPVGAGAGSSGVGGVGSPYGKDGLPAGAGAGISGAGGVGSPYGKDGLPVGAGAGISGVGSVGSPYGKDGLPAGAGAGISGAGGVGSPYGKDGLPVGADAGISGAGGVGSPYGKDGLPVGAGAGISGAGGIGGPYGKDGLPVGTGFGGINTGGPGAPYGKDGLPAGAGAGVSGAGGVGGPYGKDGLLAGAVAGAAHFPLGGEKAMGSGCGTDATLSRTPGYAGRAGGEGFSREGSALWGAGSPCGENRGSAVATAGAGGVGRLGGDEWDSVRGKGGVETAGGPGGEYGLDAHLGRSLRGETGKGTASDVRGPGNKGSAGDRGSLSGPGGARGEGRDFRQLDSLYDTNYAFGEAGSKSHDRSVDGSSSGGFGQGPLSYGQMSGPFGGPPSANQRNQEPDLDLKANDSLNNTENTAQKRRSVLDDIKVPRCYLNKQLATVRVLKGDPAELSCTVSKDNVTGTWFKDGLKLTSMDGVVFEKKGLVHKLIINKAEDIHAGKYRFEGGDVKTEASIFVEDPPQVDKVLLKNLTSVPTVAKAGEGVKLRIPFEGRGPIRAAWLKDRMELGDDTRIRVDKTDTCTTLSISSCDRRDCGDYKVRLKNDSGVLEIDLKLVVIDKPQPPAGPIKIVESSANNITIQWKPPKDDGGKPVQRYLVERQQVGRNDWETLGETPRSCTSFTTSKVEEEMSYYFRVRAVNAEGASDALESGEVKAAGKASPGAPGPPEIISASRDSITISWKAPCKTGTSQIMGYIVQKRKKGTVTWLPVNNVPVKDKKLKVSSLKKGVQYEFRVAAVNAAGTGQPSDPSEPAFARDPTKSPSQVQGLKVSSSDSTSVTLTWNKPEVEDGNDVKGYEVEMRPCNSLSWTKCFTLPAESTSCRVQGLRAGEKLFLRVRALGDGGPGEASELEACAGAAAAVVSPRLLIDDTVKSFLVIKAGNPIRVKIPFEGSPEPVVTWLKDGLPLPSRAAVSTEDGSSQLLLRAAELSDSGTYTVELGDGLGKRETFSFQVQITDIPQPPGAIRLEENVPNTVTVTWDPSASEQWEKNLYYTVLKRESQKGLWHVLGDLIYNNKFTFTRVVPGRDYYFRVVAKNDLGVSDPSDTVQPWRIWKKKAEFRVKAQKYRGVNQNQPPRFLVPLKSHVVVTGSECHMSCAVGGHPPPKITWYKDSRDLSRDPNYFCTNDFGVCSLVVLGVTKQDEGEYMVEASNEVGRAFSKAFLAIKDSSL
ncbi:immunoglobulin-like and fibronectin type III domain-containing protein 1 isoform X6 [Onychostruthus taczanowskii]|uniref:immunoglobulin-like and fibronectin type III domain-containing protein 1 isoform X6 n=1 Tax=Onychostruthus taczanowskii TaxID=356909 RepID=UPI001B806F87|nr:immunoglobulin-like and fibronectin type III domain-containing protein 1 isoform X6 [Onychostruthus taczanowskii]